MALKRIFKLVVLLISILSLISSFAYAQELFNLKWKFKTGDMVVSSPALGDVDGDGKIEVVVGSLDNNLYVLSGTRPYGDILWSKFGADNYNTRTLWNAKSFAQALKQGVAKITNWIPSYSPYK